VIGRARDTLWEAGWVGIGSLGLVLITAATTKVFTSQLGPTEYGRFVVYLTGALALGQIAFAPLAATVARFSLSYKRSSRLQEFLGTIWNVLASIGVGTLLFGAVVALAAAAFAGLASALLLIAVVAVSWFQNASALFIAFNSATRERRRAAAQQLLAGVARFAIGGLAIIAAGPYAWSVAAGYAIAGAVVFLLQARWLDPSGSVLGSGAGAPDVFDQLKGYGRPFLGWGVTAVAVAYSDVWSVRLFGGDTAAGVYAVAALLASVMAIIQGTLVQYLFPVAFEQAGLARDPVALATAFRTSRRGALLMASITLIAVIAASLGGESFVLALSSPEFQSAGAYLPILVLGVGLLVTGEVLALTSLAATQLRGLFLVKIYLAVVSVVANLIGAATLGAPGVALASVVIGSTYLMLVVLVSVRLTRVARSHVPRL